MKIRAKGQRPIEAGKGLFQPAKSPMQQAEIVVRLREARIQRDGFFVVDLRVLEAVHRREADGAHLVQGCGWIQLLGDVEAFYGFRMPAELKQQHAAVLRRLPILRIKLQGLLVVQHSFVVLPELPEQIAEVILEDRIIRLEAQGVAVVLPCVLEPTLPLQHRGETEEILRLRGLLDGAPDPFNGGVGLLRVKTEHAQQMESIRMLLVQRQRLLATQLGLGNSSRLKMREASLAKRRRRRLSGWCGRGRAAIHDGWKFDPGRGWSGGSRSSLAIEDFARLTSLIRSTASRRASRHCVRASDPCLHGCSLVRSR